MGMGIGVGIGMVLEWPPSDIFIGVFGWLENSMDGDPDLKF
jgi:hypothetical protein